MLSLEQGHVPSVIKLVLRRDDRYWRRLIVKGKLTIGIATRFIIALYLNSHFVLAKQDWNFDSKPQVKKCHAYQIAFNHAASSEHPANQV